MPPNMYPKDYYGPNPLAMGVAGMVSGFGDTMAANQQAQAKMAHDLEMQGRREALAKILTGMKTTAQVKAAGVRGGKSDELKRKRVVMESFKRAQDKWDKFVYESRTNPVSKLSQASDEELSNQFYAQNPTDAKILVEYPNLYTDIISEMAKGLQ